MPIAPVPNRTRLSSSGVADRLTFCLLLFWFVPFCAVPFGFVLCACTAPTGPRMVSMSAPPAAALFHAGRLMVDALSSCSVVLDASEVFVERGFPARGEPRG